MFNMLETEDAKSSQPLVHDVTFCCQCWKHMHNLKDWNHPLGIGQPQPQTFKRHYHLNRLERMDKKQREKCPPTRRSALTRIQPKEKYVRYAIDRRLPKATNLWTRMLHFAANNESICHLKLEATRKCISHYILLYSRNALDTSTQEEKLKCPFHLT